MMRSRPPDAPELREELAVTEAVEKALAAAPPLSDKARQVIVGLLS
jgi:hypothetical protein